VAERGSASRSNARNRTASGDFENEDEDEDERLIMGTIAYLVYFRHPSTLAAEPQLRMKNFPTVLVSCFCLAFSAPAARAEGAKILINHVGYEPGAPKRAVVLGYETNRIESFHIVDCRTGQTVFSGKAERLGQVAHWKDWRFWTIDFSALQVEGTYEIECVMRRGVLRSFPFPIQRDLLERNTLSSVIYYFKGQRCSGLLDQADRNLKFEGSTNTADVHGGWYDATGDYGKHLSHLSYSTYFNPQQTSFTVWSLFKGYDELEARGDTNFWQFERRLLDEAMYGADYLVRLKNPEGSFYRSIGAPGPGKKPEDRRISREGKGFAIKTAATRNKMVTGDTNLIEGKAPYEVGFRNGGGMAIAALAMAARYDVSGEFSTAAYRRVAEEAFAYLQKNNRQYANDGRENMVDDYCALLAATELFKLTTNAEYKVAADQRARQLMARLTSDGVRSNYWRADDAGRPFFHAADAGLPVVSLLEYSAVADGSVRPIVLGAVRKSLEFELRTTAEVPNPFGYARQFVQTGSGLRRTTFFFPHDTETAPWWQGENARLGSLAAAARMAAPSFAGDPAFQARLKAYAWDQLDWILGLNPFDCCMLHGSGRNNVPYMFFELYEYNNAPGGIVNGITGGYSDLDGIDFNLGYAVTGKDEDWRWTEQWLPHASWYLLAVAAGR
jgi:hypothetical protein